MSEQSFHFPDSVRDEDMHVQARTGDGTILQLVIRCSFDWDRNVELTVVRDPDGRGLVSAWIEANGVRDRFSVGESVSFMEAMQAAEAYLASTTLQDELDELSTVAGDDV